MAREVLDRRQRAGDRRVLRQPNRSPRLRRPRAHRRAGGQRVRVGAAAAQFEVGPLSRRPGEFERRRRPLSHRFDRPGRQRSHPEDGARRAAQRGRRRRRASLHAVVAGQQEARFPARLSHRAGRRQTVGAELRRHGRHPAVQRRRRLRQVAQGRLSPLLRRDRELRRPRRDDSERTTPTARSIRTSSTPTAFRCCDSTPSSPSTRSTRRSTCRKPSARSSTRWAARRCRRCRRRKRSTASSRSGASSTRSARRGWATTRRTSVLNANCQAHDVKNLFVADAGPFVSNAHKNCTWTILALAMRTAECIAQQRNQGTL